MKRTFSLRVKFFFISIGLLFFGLIFFILLILPYISERLQDIEINDTKFNNENAVRNIENEINDLVASIYFAAYNPVMDDYLITGTQDVEEKLRQTMMAVMEKKNVFVKLKFLDTAGQEIISLNRANGRLVTVSRVSLQNEANSRYFQEAIANTVKSPHFSHIELDREGDPPVIVTPYRPSIRISYTVVDRAGSKRGLMTAMIDFKSLLGEYNIGAHGEFIILDAKGYYINHPDPKKQFSSPMNLNAGHSIRSDYPSDAGTVLLEDKGFLRRSNYVLWFRKLAFDVTDKSKDIILVNIVSETDLLEPISNIQQSIMLIYTIILSSMIAALYLLINRLMRPILLLTEAIKPIASGDFSRKIAVESTDELGVLSHGIDAMRLKLAQLYNDLDQRVRDQTSELQAKITELQCRSRELEDTKNAMLNIAEDLENEKNLSIEQKRNAELLAKDLEKFKLATESSSDHITISDTDGRILYANKAVTDITGYSHDEIIGQKVGSQSNWGGLMNDDFYHNLWKVVKYEKKSLTAEFINKRKDGSKYIGLVTVTPIMDFSGQVLFFVENQRDITEEKEKEKEKAKDEAILESLGECLVVTDVDGKILLVNKAFEKKMGWSKDEALGKELIELLPLLDQRKVPVRAEERALYKVLRQIKREVHLSDSSQTNYYVTKYRSVVPIYGVVTPIVVNGNIIGAVEVFRDITKEKEIDKLKDDFISVASHELRTPLTAIDGIVSMILDGEYGKLDDNLRQPLSDVTYSSQRLIHLVNDMLSMSRIQAGRLKYRLSEYKYAESINVVTKLLSTIAESRNISLVVGKINDEVIQADREKVEQILNNLIGNSLKFTDKGSVRVDAEINGQMIKIKVTDTGIGIADADRSKLFGKFQQLESGVDRPQGTGLGLHISKQMARAMGGDVYLESSVLAMGSVFVLCLPIAKSAAAEKAKINIEEEAYLHADQK